MDVAGKRAYRLVSVGFWRAYLITMRPYLLPVSGAAGLAGMAFIPEPVTWRVLLGFLPLFLSYGLGQALTDCFQTDTDSISSPYRPLVQGLVTRRQVMAVSLTGLIAGVLIVGWLNLPALVPAALTVVGLLTYTYLKRTWWGGPPWNSWIVMLLPVIGRFVDADFRAADLGRAGAAFYLALGAIFFGYANFVVMGYFKDISADRQAGYNTFPVRFGWLANSIYSDVLALLAAGLSAAAIVVAGVRPAGGLVWLVGFGLNLLAQVRMHFIRDEQQSHGPIANVVRAFVLYCLAIVLVLKPGWLAGAAVLYVVFELVLKLRPERTQV
jgi:4-hydroxybenzoate polyprenyltransferase